MPPPISNGYWLVEEIIIILSCKIILSSGLAAKRFTVTDFLEIVQTAGDSLISVAVESIQIDGSSCVNSGIYFRTFKDRLSVYIHDARGSCAVCIDEVAVFVSLIVRSFKVAVTKRCLDCSESCLLYTSDAADE